MEGLIKGDVVVVSFPFSNLTKFKNRPAYVLCNLSGDDIILCQITSQSYGDNYSIELQQNDISGGSLRNEISYIRPNKIFTAEKSIIFKKIGSVRDGKKIEVSAAIINLINS